MPYDPPMQPINATVVAFDKDGTLIDFYATWGPAIVSMLSDVSDDRNRLHAAAEHLGINLETGTVVPGSPFLAESTGEIAIRLSPILGRDDLVELAEELDSSGRRHSVASVTGVEGVVDTLVAVSQMGMSLAVATNDSEATAQDQLERLGLAQYFDAVLGYDSGHGAKPGPGMLLEIGDRFGCPMNELVMVGDTPTDISAAIAAGARSVLIDPTRQYDTSADAVIESFAHLPGVLG